MLLKFNLYYNEIIEKPQKNYFYKIYTSINMYSTGISLLPL